MDNRKTNNQPERGFLGYTVLLLSIGIVLVLSYVSYWLAAAEYAFGKSLLEAAANRGNETYRLMIRAIQLNPYELRYRISYSQTNLALANSIASKEDITDTDRATIQQLVEQAIQEGKAAVALNRLQAGNWANLANIYRNLVNVATGADQWAVASYQQAIALDPNNPQLRLVYGQLLYSLNQFDAAQRQFEAATLLKPDFSNAYYNLAFAYKQQEKWQLAKLSFEQTLNLVEIGSQDYETTKKDLDEVNKKLAEAGEAAAQAEGEEKAAEGAAPEEKELEGPEEASPAARLEPPIKLPEKEAAPEITPSSPSPSPSPKTTPSPGAGAGTPSPRVSPAAGPTAAVSPAF